MVFQTGGVVGIQVDMEMEMKMEMGIILRIVWDTIQIENGMKMNMELMEMNNKTN